MAAGNFHQRRNASDASVLPNAGTNLDVSWDTLVRQDGTIVTYSDPNLQLDTGLYLIIYSDKFSTTNTTNNERVEIQGEIHAPSLGYVGGYGQDIIRKSSGQQSCVVSGMDIVDITADNTDVFIRFYRTDNSTSGTVDRVSGEGSVVIVQLDDTQDYGFYSTSASEATSGTTERTLQLDTNDRQDTGFSRTGAVVDVANAGRYFVTYGLDLSTTGTGREDVVGRLTNAGTELVGSTSFCYLRGIDGCQDGALSWGGILDLPAGADVDMRWSAPLSATITAAAGAYLKMWRLPAAADVAIKEATTGNYAAADPFVWDTLPFIDTDSFTATAGSSNIDVDQTDYILAFANFHQNAPDSGQRIYPEARFKVNTVVNAEGVAGVYHRNSGGSGIVSLNVAALMQVPGNASIEVQTVETAASGTMTNDSAQFAILSLESIFGPYAFPPSISGFNGGTNAFLWGAENVLIAGTDFGAVQGTGRVEIWDDESGTTKVTQTVDSWSDTSIQIDTVRGSLPDDTTVYIVVVGDGGVESAPFPVSVGLLGYSSAVDGLLMDHLWRLNNDYLDSGDTGPQRDMTVGVVGGGAFTTNVICEDTTHCWHINGTTVRREISDSENMNITNTLRRRTIGCWIQLNGTQKSFGAIWKEGGGVQNLAFLTGLGNVLLAQLADVAGSRDNVQAVSDFRLTPSRPYHIAMRYDQDDSPDARFELYVDGALQTVTDGNPMTINIFDTHSGDVTWGEPDNNLETGAVDVDYPGQEDTYMSYFFTVSENSSGIHDGALDPDDDIRDILFRRGAIPNTTISSDTQANMQTALDAVSSIPDWPLGIRVESPSSGSDLTLTADAITIDDRTTDHIEWRGSGTLTIINRNGSNIDQSKCWSATGGMIVVQEEVDLTLTVLDATDSTPIENARVRVTVAASVGPYLVGDVLIEGVTDASGVITAQLVYEGVDPSVTGRVRKGSASTFYKTSDIVGTVTSEGLTQTVFMVRDE